MPKRKRKSEKYRKTHDTEIPVFIPKELREKFTEPNKYKKGAKPKKVTKKKKSVKISK